MAVPEKPTSNAYTPASGTGWLNTPEVPLVDDIVSVHEPYLRAIHISPVDKSSYLEAEYFKLRYEAIQPLRNAVREYRQKPDEPEYDTVNVYPDVRFQGFMITDDGVASRVSFSTSQTGEDVAWATSKRLLPGALVLLSPTSDHFSSKYLLAIVAHRFLYGGLLPDVEAGEQPDSPPRIDLFFPQWHDDLVDLSASYTMLESKSGYFESVRHAMSALQQAASEKSQLDDYILGVKTKAKPSDLKPQNSRFPQPSGLDASQLDAFEHMRSRQLSLIQGPPGTGKTFTTVVAIRQLVLDTNRPIVVAAQTNHAVDQLVQRCSDAGVDRICRLGSRCSKEVDNFRIFHLRGSSRYMQTPRIRQIVGPARADVNRVRSCLVKALSNIFSGPTINAEMFYDQGILSAEQYESLQNIGWETDGQEGLELWLNRHEPYSSSGTSSTSLSSLADEARPAPYTYDPERPRGVFIKIPTSTQNSKPTRNALSQLSRFKDLYKIKAQRREDVFRAMCQKLTEAYLLTAQDHFEQYNRACKLLSPQKQIRDAALLQAEAMQIVCCTVTGLSKYRRMIADLAPEIVLIDEASEAFEATISAAALLPSIKQLSLVGDHQQLTPRPSTELMKQEPYSLNISLFERLVHQQDYKILLCQRRMVPKIRHIISEYYPHIHDHDSVKQRTSRPGARNLWWFDHKWPETKTAKKSFCNFIEAKMAAQLAVYLVQSGLLAEHITILTVYSGQVEAINRALCALEGEASRVAVRTVDGFQGCENDVIILSLVRSERPGFVADVHRATVALSRARNSMYVFGNSANLLGRGGASRLTWEGVLKRFEETSSIGPPLGIAATWGELERQITPVHEDEREMIEKESASPKTLPKRGLVGNISAMDSALFNYKSDHLMELGYLAYLLEAKTPGSPTMAAQAPCSVNAQERDNVCMDDLIYFD